MFRTCSVLLYFDKDCSDEFIENIMKLIEYLPDIKGGSYLINKRSEMKYFKEKKYTLDKTKPIDLIDEVYETTK